jgi:RNA polymerase sigma-70 factor (ECF subfamily)
MRRESSRDVLRHLQTLYRCGVVGPLSDEQLLDRFVARRDEMAEESFTELVQRHGPMVLGVCRRVLGDAHEAEDAFQATFLVLARKAASVLRREKVANWLYGVAVRTAQEARGRAARRRAREGRVRTPVQFEPPDGSPAELRAILDEELARLPPRYREAVVLCELEGLSRWEAAGRLGVPEGTLSSRLARAKARLRDRLVRRGIALPAVALAGALLREARATTLPLALVESTVEAATLVAAGPAALATSASVAALTQGVIKAMLLAKLKGIALGLGTLTAVVSGAVVLAQAGPRPGAAPSPPPPAVDQGPREIAPTPPPSVDQGPREIAPPPPPAQGRTRRSTREPENPPVPPDQAPPPPAPVDRTAALERKLDRILDALERFSRTTPAPAEVLAGIRDVTPAPGTGAPRMSTPPPAAEVGPTPEYPPQAPTIEPPPALRPPSALPPQGPTAMPEPAPTPLPQPGPSPSALPALRAAGPRGSQSIADRLSAVEHRLDELEAGVRQTYSFAAHLKSRLNDLERRVGGPASGPSDSTVAPDLPPSRRRSMPPDGPLPPAQGTQ